jgi:hypothetical protein
VRREMPRPALSEAVATAIWNGKTKNGTKASRLIDFDYYRNLPVDAKMQWGAGARCFAASYFP